MKKCFIIIEFWDNSKQYHYRSETTSFRKAAKLFKQCRKLANGKEISVIFKEVMK